MQNKLFVVVLGAVLSVTASAQKIVIKGSDTLGAKMVPQLAEADGGLCDWTLRLGSLGPAVSVANLHQRESVRGCAKRRFASWKLRLLVEEARQIIESKISLSRLDGSPGEQPHCQS